MKYIDAEKLIAEIERLYDIARDASYNGEIEGEMTAYDKILSIITSLQQEQSEVQNGKIVFPKYLYARTKDNKTIDMSYAPQDMTAVEYIRNDFVEQEQPETDMKSPFTGGKVAILSRQEEETFRGEKIKVTRKYYRCVDTGREFTDSKLDDDMMWAAFRAYCEKKGMTSFTDIMLKQEQPEADLEKETKRWWKEHLHLNPENQLWMDAHQSVVFARHFFELGLNARKEE